MDLTAPPLSPSMLAWLRCFDAAARCGSFTKAAQELHVSQGAVSQQVKRLEDRLGHALLLRTTAGLALTPQGEQLYAATRDSFRSMEVAVHRLQAAHTGEPVNLSCSPSFAMLWLTLRLGNLYRAHPTMSLRVVGESDEAHPARLARDGIAGAVRLCAPDGGDAHGVDLLEEWLVPVAAPKFMQAHPELRTVGQLKGAQLLHAADPGESGQPTEDWDRWLKSVGVSMPASALRQGTQFNLSLLALQAALDGQGIMMGRLALVLHYLTSGRLVVAYRHRVLAHASYRFVASPTHRAAPTILHWLTDEASRFRQLRDAFFKESKVSPA